MRIIMIGLFIVVFGVLARAQEMPLTVSAGGAPVLSLKVPAGTKVTPMKEKTVIQTTNMFLHVWLVPGAKTPNDAIPRLAEVIKGDVLDFRASATNEIVVAGSPAKHLIGAGKEADDGDAATADIVLFVVGDHVLVACVHGEGNDASHERQPMMALLKTARAP